MEGIIPDLKEQIEELDLEIISDARMFNSKSSSIISGQNSDLPQLLEQVFKFNLSKKVSVK